MKNTKFILLFLLICNISFAEDKWVEVNTDDFPDSYENITFLDSLNGFIQGAFAIYKTTDGGANWRNIYQLQSEYSFISCFTMLEDGTGFLSTNEKNSLKTTDYGENWLKISYPSTDNISSIFVVDKNKVWLLTYGPDVFSTTDGGANWVKSDTQFEQEINPSEIYFLDPSQGFLLCNNKIDNFFKTTDGGINWEKKALPSDSALSSIFFINNEIGWLGGVGGTMLKTTDAGETWQLVQFPTNDLVWDVFFLDSLEGWVAAVHWDINWMNRYGKIFYTSDGGKNWTLQFSEPENSGSLEIMSIDFPTRNKGWASGNNGVLLTMDRTTSVKEAIITNEFQATPVLNSINGTVKFILNTTEGGYISFELFDYMGKKVISKAPQYYQNGTNEISFNIATLSAGVYLYRFTFNSQIYSGKILIN